jgi:hypothetical protein
LCLSKHERFSCISRSALTVSNSAVSDRLEDNVDESKRRAVRFLEKEIKTYTALSLFLSKKGIKEHVRVGEKRVLISPSFYKERMKEAKKLVYELKNPN